MLVSPSNHGNYEVIVSLLQMYIHAHAHVRDTTSISNLGRPLCTCMRDNFTNVMQILVKFGMYM